MASVGHITSFACAVRLCNVQDIALRHEVGIACYDQAGQQSGKRLAIFDMFGLLQQSWLK